MYTEIDKSELGRLHTLGLIHSIYDRGALLSYNDKVPTAYWKFVGDKHEIVIGEPSYKLAKRGKEGTFLKRIYRHERAHALYTDRDLEKVAKACRDEGVDFRLLNLFEDIRIEHCDRITNGVFDWKGCMTLKGFTPEDAVGILYYMKCKEKSYCRGLSPTWKLPSGKLVNGYVVAGYFDSACGTSTTMDLIDLVKRFIKEFELATKAGGEGGEGEPCDDGDEGEGEGEGTDEGEGEGEGEGEDTEGEGEGGGSKASSDDGGTKGTKLDEALKENGLGDTEDDCEMADALKESERPEHGTKGSRVKAPVRGRSTQQDQSVIADEWSNDQLNSGYTPSMVPNKPQAKRIATALNGLIVRGRSTKLDRRGKRPVARSVARHDWDRLFIGKAEGTRAKPRLLVITDMSGSMDGQPSMHAATINLGIAMSDAVVSTHAFTSAYIARTVPQEMVKQSGFFDTAMAGSCSEGIAQYIERKAKDGLAKQFDYILCITDGYLTDGVPKWDVLALKGLDKVAAVYVGDEDTSDELKKHFKRHLSVTDAKEVGARLKALLRK